MSRFWLTVIFALVFHGCAFKDNRSVSIEPEHLVCSSDSDCVFAHLSCSSCGGVIGREYASEYRSAVRKLCKNYRGPVVDCVEFPTPGCVAGTCSDAHLQPDVVEFIERRDLCDHFRGEEPYDADRKAFLYKRMEELCTGTDSEVEFLRFKYLVNPAALDALKKYEDSVEKRLKPDSN